MRHSLRDWRALCYPAELGLLFLACCAGCGSTYNAPNSVPSVAPATPSSSMATVFTMSNATSGNTVLTYARNADGTLSQVASFATGGLGVGHGLENQGALA